MITSLHPPRGSLRYQGSAVRSLTRAPDARWYVAREEADTVLVDVDELACIEVVE